MNAIEFGYKVLQKENLNDWKIVIVDGDEGFCDRKIQTILFGRKSIKDYELMLHEITHCLTKAYHYSKEFENTLEKLKNKYLNIRGKIIDF